MSTAICWTLVHSVWQGLLLSLLAGIVLLTTRTSRPALRYHLLSGLFILFAGAALITFLWEWNNASTTNPSTAVLASFPGVNRPSEPGTFANAEGYWQQLVQFLSLHSLLIVSVWGCILGFKLIRTGGTFFYTRYVRDHRSTPLSPDWQERLASLCTRLRIGKPVRLLGSTVIKIPAVFGHWKPVIFIPAGLLTQLPPEQVEAILAHELAHIRRSDFLVNLLQNIVETIFFFNPAVWWVSSLIRQEREHCCDDIAIAQTGDKKRLIEALVSFRQLSVNTSGLAIGFPGDRNSFINRITRIVRNKNRSINPAESLFLALSLVAVGALSLAFMQHNQDSNGKVGPMTPMTDNVLITRDTTPKLSRDTVIFTRNGNRHKAVSPNKEYQVVLDTIRSDSDKVKFRVDRERLEAEIKEMKAKREEMEAKREDMEVAQKEINEKQERLEAAQVELEMKQKELAVDREKLEKAKQKMWVTREIMEDIMKQHLVSSGKDLKSFSLTNEAFIINGQKQPTEVHQWFKNKYIHGTSDAYKMEGQFSVDH